MAHIVIEITICSLSESLLTSSSNVRAAAPLISTSVMAGQFLLVDLRHIFSDSLHACACPLFSQSIHMCSSVSMTSVLRFFLQKGQITRSVCPGTLFQKFTHLIFSVSMSLM